MQNGKELNQFRPPLPSLLYLSFSYAYAEVNPALGKGRTAQHVFYSEYIMSRICGTFTFAILLLQEKHTYGATSSQVTH